MIDLRHLPAVDKLLNQPQVIRLIDRFGRAQVLTAIQEELSAIRANPDSFSQDDLGEKLIQRIAAKLEQQTKPSLVRVINASGVILHTNLGRAPLSQYTIETIRQAAISYSNLEFDLESGRRGRARFMRAICFAASPARRMPW